MPKYPNVYPKRLKNGSILWYGAKTFRGKTYTAKSSHSAKEASEAIKERIKQLESGIKIDKKKITVEEFIKLYLDKHYITKPDLQNITKKGTINLFKNSVIPIMGNRILSEVTPEDIQDLQNKLLSKYSPSSVRLILKKFKHVFHIAIFWKYIISNPFFGYEGLKIKTQKPITLEPEQVYSILHDERIDIRERAIIGLGSLAGLRFGELFGLQWNKINFDERTILIDLQYSKEELKPPKKDSTRIVPILPELEPLLKEWRLRCGSMKWVFPGQMGRPLSRNWARHFKKILRERNLKDVTFHSLRHLFDRMMHDALVHTRDIMQIMGHKTEAMSRHYDSESIKHLLNVTRNLKVFDNDLIRISVRNKEKE